MLVLIVSIILTITIAHDEHDEHVEGLNCAIKGHGQIEVNGKLMSYNIQDDQYIVEGDIIVASIDRRRLLPITTGGLWENGYIPYILDSSLSSSTISKIKTAMAHWESNTIINFDVRNGETDYVRFKAGDGCSAHLGRTGGEQDITLGDGCSIGNAIHEIGHCIGFWHTQSREDRDLYVDINWDNIEEGKRGNFEREIDDADDCLTYDYGSIMHYPTWAFAIDSNIATITPKQDTNGVKIGQRSGLSSIDLACINILYGGGGGGSTYKPIESFGGNCLDIDSANWQTNAGKVQMWSCHGYDNQEWYLTSNNEIKSKGGKCLDVHYNDYHSKINGATIQIWECNGWDNQKFYMDGNQIKSKNDKCLDIHVNDLYNSEAKVQLWDCNQSKQQSWNF